MNLFMTTLSSYSLNNQTYLLRQRQCDHLVTVHKLVTGGTLGAQTSTGQKWVNFYDVMVPFVLGGEQYFFGLAKQFINPPPSYYSKAYWIIAKLDETGNKEIIDYDFWEHDYDVGFAYQADKRLFIYLHSQERYSNGTYQYVIYEVLPNGKMERKPTDKNSWPAFYGATFFFSNGNKEYIFLHTPENNINSSVSPSYTYELSKDGRIGKQISSVTISHNDPIPFPYYFASPYTLNNQQQFVMLVTDPSYIYYYFNTIDNNGAIIGYDYTWNVNAKLLNINLIVPIENMTPFFIDQKPYIFIQDQNKDLWSILTLDFYGDTLYTLNVTDNSNN
ncbi:hypothetical protein [Xenorhabdus thailandensis]|uniref:hypothetical protein n=1 Tax=Xenorhabdus thailandensis TaxID=3136255 RepID=UPI0030F3EA34